MDISLNEFYMDLFESFHYNKLKIDEQLERDFDRLTFYFNQTKVLSKDNFYYLLNSLPYSRIIKRLLWVIPNQATLFPFYVFFQQKFGDKIIAELPRDCEISNDFTVRVDPLNGEQIQVKMFKNFRIVENVNFLLHDVGYILMEIQFILGNPTDKQIHMKYQIIPPAKQMEITRK